MQDWAGLNSTDYDETCGTDVVISQTIGGVQVLKIGFESFVSKGITSVVFPNGLEKIEEFAFSWNNISRVELPRSVIRIANGAFISNPLTYVYLENTSPEYIRCQIFGNDDSIEHNVSNPTAFSDCE